MRTDVDHGRELADAALGRARSRAHPRSSSSPRFRHGPAPIWRARRHVRRARSRARDAKHPPRGNRALRGGGTHRWRGCGPSAAGARDTTRGRRRVSRARGLPQLSSAERPQSTDVDVRTSPRGGRCGRERRRRDRCDPTRTVWLRRSLLHSYSADENVDAATRAYTMADRIVHFELTADDPERAAGSATPPTPRATSSESWSRSAATTTTFWMRFHVRFSAYMASSDGTLSTSRS